MNVRHGHSAMCGHFARVSEALRPLHEHMVSLILACPVLQADETSVRMLPSEEEGKAVTCRLRVRRTGLGPTMTAFHFSRDRSIGTAQSILGGCHGTVIRDGYAGFSGLSVDVACRWAHCRRWLVEAHCNHPELADRAIALIRGLHAIEAAAGAEAKADGAGNALTKSRRRHSSGPSPWRTSTSPTVAL